MATSCRSRVPFLLLLRSLLPIWLAAGATLAVGSSAEAQCVGGLPDFNCQPSENCLTCEDCLNAICDGGDTCALCPSEHCCPVCGQNGCESAKGENCANCFQDCCPRVCGQNGCESAKGETCANCFQDCCPPVCGANGCEGAKGETCATCPADCCPAVCGANGCEGGKGETCATCPADCCPAVCGANGCEGGKGETCATCPADCCPSEFYVRDWTRSVAAGDHDDGTEPSNDGTVPYVFYDRSDVWNRLTNDPGPFVSDKPQNQNPVTVTSGSNFGFVRVHRRTGPGFGLPAATVSAQFFRVYGGIGLGVNFLSIGTATLNFLASETQKTLPAGSGLAWTLPDTASGHLCFAVEITAVDTTGLADPPQSPGILGGFAGQGIREDNNKAQRNLEVVPVPSPSPAPAASGGAAPAASGGARRMGFLAIAHNGLTYPRTMVVRYQVAPEVLRRLGNAEVEVVGGERAALKAQGELRLANMQPGENRWIGLTVDLPAGGATELLPVTFIEVPKDKLASGFTIAFQPTPLAAVILETLGSHSAVFRRMFALFQLPAAREQAAAAAKARDSKPSPEEYAKLLREWLPTVSGLTGELLKGRKDLFQLGEALEVLDGALKADDHAAVAASHATLLNRLDPFLTMLQLEAGDPADIIQNLYWQMSLFSRVPEVSGKPYARTIVELSADFIRAHGRLSAELDYSTFLESILSELRAAVVDLRQQKPDLEEDLAAIERNLGSPVPLQKAHRGLLLKLQSLVNGGVP